MLRDRIVRKLETLSDELTGTTRGVVDRARELREPAGLAPVRGPGVTITLTDAPEAVIDSVETAEEINNLVVHQQDIQAVVNALWLGGADAVTIAGQRVISTTGIKCEGNAVQLQGVPYPQPFVIEAVGEPTDLADSVALDPLVSGYLEDSTNPEIEIGWDLETRDSVTAPAYAGLLDLQYAKPLNESE